MVNVISLFCGCGGSSLGYKRAGCNVILASDFNQRAIQTYKLNFKTKTLVTDIRNLTGNELTKETGIKKGQLDILDGSPPCTPFSTTGDREKSWNKVYKHTGERQAQITNDLFYEYIRIIKELQPKTFIAENVHGLIIGAAKGYYLEIIKRMKQAGYKLETFDLNAKDFEVPQSRPRIVIIGIRKDIKQKDVKLRKHEEISFYQATKDLKLSQQTLNEMKSSFNKSVRLQFGLKTKQGQSLGDSHPRRFGFNSYKLSLHKPMRTVTAHPRQLMHPIENRWICLDEIKRCASFPDSFKFLSEAEGYMRIGNSVPPNLIKNIALYLIEKAGLN